MFALAIVIGIYSYGIFLLGILGMLYPRVILVFSVLFIVVTLYLQTRSIGRILEIREIWERAKRSRFCAFLLFFLVAQGLINLVGALGPEHGFDALWYHLTLPKMYLAYHTIVHFPGGILYYSDMPKLTEMIYVAALALQGETLAKITHLFFGVLSVLALYKLARLLLPVAFSLLAAAIFYSNLVVGWESITAYVDLTRTFFEILALFGIILYVSRNDKKWLYESAVMLGLAVTTKLLAIGSLLPLCLIIVWYGIKSKQKRKNIISSTLLYCLIVMIIPMPWFVFSFIHTGSPVYPFFSTVFEPQIPLFLANPIKMLHDVYMLFTKAADPISPLYLMTIPLVFFSFRKYDTQRKMVVIYSLAALFVWYITPQTGGGRFIVPYLPAFSLVTAFVIEEIHTLRFSYRGPTISFANIVIVFVLLISLLYRGVANSKYIPVLLGQETKAEFLTKHLNFSFGDFYDTDSYFQKTITGKDKVLLYGFHNLYYVDFPFIDSSWVQKGNTLNYIAVQNGEFPDRFRHYSHVNFNQLSKVRLYTPQKQQWIY